MYNVIQLSVPKTPVTNQFRLGTFNESTDKFSCDQLYTESVFSNGKQKVMPLVPIIQKIKDSLDQAVDNQIKGGSDAKQIDGKKNPNYFDPVAFWRSVKWKELEDEIQKIFGFRNVRVHPFQEEFKNKSKDFSSKVMNCLVYNDDRYPIEGLVTDEGFYDKSKSLQMEIYISLGLLKALTAEEVIGVFLHEFGHSIDPALVDIKYTETNILSKYLTDRKEKINREENKYLKKMKIDNESHGFKMVTMIALAKLAGLSIFGDLFGNSKKAEEKKLEKIRKIIAEEKDNFNRQEFSEAFADNFARMYGFGAQLMSGISKIGKKFDKDINSTFKREKSRQQYILMMTKDLINDEHKTDIHRIRALIREYEDDMKDPNTPDQLKKQMQEDLEELKKVLNIYLNDFSDFQNKVNAVINEELMKKDGSKSSETKNVNESAEIEDDYFKSIPLIMMENVSRAVAEKQIKLFGHILAAPTYESGMLFHLSESKKAYDKLMERSKTITSTERSEFYKIFGNSKECSLAKDKNGYYVYTHRCRSKSYPSIDKIPQKDVNFVRSTS